MQRQSMKWLCLLVAVFAGLGTVHAQQKVLVNMDLKQTDHLKAYGVAYWALTRGIEVDWLLNYRGGSYLIQYDKK